MKGVDKETFLAISSDKKSAPMKKLIVLIILLLFATTGWATTFYFNENGVDDANCTSASGPCATMAYLLANADIEPNDIIEFRALAGGGSYTHFETQVRIDVNDEGSSGNPVIIRGRAGDTIIWSGAFNTAGAERDLTDASWTDTTDSCDVGSETRWSAADPTGSIIYMMWFNTGSDVEWGMFENNLADLSRIGEFYDSGGTIYVCSDEDPSTKWTEITATGGNPPSTAWLLKTYPPTSASTNKADFLTFQNIIFEKSAVKGLILVNASYSEGIVFDDCTFRFSANGLTTGWAQNTNAHLQVKNSTFTDMYDGDSIDDETDVNEITANYLRCRAPGCEFFDNTFNGRIVFADGSTERYTGAAIELSNATGCNRPPSDAKVYRNTITYFGNYGIHLEVDANLDFDTGCTVGDVVASSIEIYQNVITDSSTIIVDPIIDNDGIGIGGNNGSEDNRYTGIKIYRNRVERAIHTGIGFADHEGEGGLIYANIIVDSASDGSNVGGIRANRGSLIYNNTLYDNDRFQIISTCSGTAAKTCGSGVWTNDAPITYIKNNIFSNNVQAGTLIEADGVANTIVQYNLGYNYNTACTGNCTWDGTNLSATDPLLTAPDSNNFTIRAASPARDAGETLSIHDSSYRDYAGMPLIGAPEIGAYEFAARSRVSGRLNN